MIKSYFHINNRVSFNFCQFWTNKWRKNKVVSNNSFSITQKRKDFSVSAYSFNVTKKHIKINIDKDTNCLFESIFQVFYYYGSIQKPRKINTHPVEFICKNNLKWGCRSFKTLQYIYYNIIQYIKGYLFKSLAFCEYFLFHSM